MSTSCKLKVEVGVEIEELLALHDAAPRYTPLDMAIQTDDMGRWRRIPSDRKSSTRVNREGRRKEEEGRAIFTGTAEYRALLRTTLRREQQHGTGDGERHGAKSWA